MENQTDSQLLEKAIELLGRIYPGALWASCKYKDVEGADPTFHCCDWNEIVEEMVSFSVDLSFSKGDDHNFNIPDELRATKISRKG